MKRIVSLTFSMLLAVATFAANYQTIVFTVNPQMSCQNCENKIKSNLRYEKGVKEINTSLENQTVTIVYDTEKNTPANIESAFKKIGYTATLTDGSQKTTQAKACAKGKACCKAGGKCNKADGKCCKDKAKAHDKCEKAATKCSKDNAKCDKSKSTK